MKMSEFMKLAKAANRAHELADSYVRRAGKKDQLTKEITKIQDYASRWLDYEAERTE